MAFSSHQLGGRGGWLYVTLCSLVSSDLYLWHLLRGPLKPRGQFTGVGESVDDLLEGPNRGRAVKACGSEPWEQEEAFCSERDLPEVQVKAGAQTSIRVCRLAGHWTALRLQ